VRAFLNQNQPEKPGVFVALTLTLSPITGTGDKENSRRASQYFSDTEKTKALSRRQIQFRNLLFHELRIERFNAPIGNGQLFQRVRRSYA
jgi:hypothetical protein